jgi:L-iditol 2-dehydrogenase
MKAIVCHAPGKYLFEEIARPVAGPKELIVKNHGCGICASDMKANHGAAMFWGGDNPWLKAPVVPGHEFFGEVVEMGAGAAEHFGVKIGDHVISEQILPCGECRFCRDGKYWMCEVHNMHGFQKDVGEGGMAEYMRYPANARVHLIPKNLSFNEKVLIEPMACAIHTVERADPGFRDVVVLAGAGTLGLCMVQAIKLKTPKTFVVLDMNDGRLALAKKLGADIVLNPGKVNVDAEIRALTGGYGCDIYIEATGNPAAVKQGLQIIRRLGRYVEFSVFGQETTVDWSIIGDRKELDLLGAHLGPHCYEVAIDLFRRKLISAEGIVTSAFKLSDSEKAFVSAEAPNAIKTVFKMV